MESNNSTNYYIELLFDLDEPKIDATFYYFDANDIDFHDFNSRKLVTFTKTDNFNTKNIIVSLNEVVNNLLKTPEVIKYFNENPEEYFNTTKLYRDVYSMKGRKVPQKAFITAIKLLKNKGEQNITTIRRIVDPKLLSSNNVKPLLRSLHSFDLIKLEKRGRNVFIVPTPKLIKTPLNKLI